MTTYVLKKCSIEDGEDIFHLLQSIPDENGFCNDAFGLSYLQYKQWLHTQVDMGNGIGLLDWMVPQTHYFLYVDGVVVGVGKLRHYLNDGLRKHGGHIGYAIAATYRRQGYAKKLLKLILQEAKSLSIESALCTCDPDNIASQKTIEANGGILTQKTEESYFYWITLS